MHDNVQAILSIVVLNEKWSVEYEAVCLLRLGIGLNHKRNKALALFCIFAVLIAKDPHAFSFVEYGNQVDEHCRHHCYQKQSIGRVL